MTTFVSNMDQFDDLVASGSKEAILLGGELVYLTNDKSALDALQGVDAERFVIQPPRIASRGRLIESKKEYLYVAISKQAAEYSQSYRGTVAVAADHYLAYGLAQKKNCIVVGGGYTDQGEINLEFFVLDNHRLVETVERTVSNNAFMIEDAYNEVIDRFPNFVIYWCDPLGDPPIRESAGNESCILVGNLPVKNIIRRKIHSKSQNLEESWGAIPSLLVALSGLGLFAILMGYQWMGIDAERKEYQTEVEGYEAEYSNSAQSLDLLRQREFTMRPPEEAIARINLVDSLLSRSSQIKGVVIHSVKVFAPGDPEANSISQTANYGSTQARQDDFRLDISVPQSSSGGARDQAEPIVAMLNSLTGMTVSVIDHTSNKIIVGESEALYWRYKIGGMRHVQ